VTRLSVIVAWNRVNVVSDSWRDVSVGGMFSWRDVQLAGCSAGGMFSWRDVQLAGCSAA